MTDNERITFASSDELISQEGRSGKKDVSQLFTASGGGMHSIVLIL
jgi:hypothetical protein